MYCIRPVIHERPGWISRSTLSGRSGTCFGRNREWTRGTPPQLTAQVLLVASPGPVELSPLLRLRRELLAFGSEPARRQQTRSGHTSMSALRTCRRCRKQFAEACAGDVTAKNQLPSWLIPMVVVRTRGGCARSSRGNRAWQRLCNRSQQRTGCAEVAWARIADCALSAQRWLTR
jgi:hypothetical protein